MSLDAVEERLIRALEAPAPTGSAADLDAPLPGSSLTGRRALAIFEAMLISRQLDLAARALRARGEGFYTIASAGHEGNAVLGELLRGSDLGFVHYRSGGLFVRRLQRAPGETPIFDVLLSMCASAEDPVSGGRHKVWGSRALNLPPQTSTIASHLPKAMGAAFALGRMQHLGLEGLSWAPRLPQDAIVFASFGDASLNHSTAQGALNTALWASYQGLPVPLLMICEDNGLGISVRSPERWVEASVRGRPGLAWFSADGCDLVDTWETASQAIAHCRERRSPTFLHLSTVRLGGHAGSDVEAVYRAPSEIAAAEARDPLLAAARLLIEARVATPAQLAAARAEIAERVEAAAREAARRPRHESAASVMASMVPRRAPEAVMQAARSAPGADERRRAHGGTLPEEGKPRHLAVQLGAGLRDLMLSYPQALVFGEDVARKGGVYRVSAGLEAAFGGGRVFNTLLDEQSILGLAIGAAHLGLLPIPEIQFLAYYHNAEDQLRGEACSLSFFSRGQWRNPMLVRIASFGYQRGFGGHFHNDASIAALRDVPGLVVCAPSRGDDAVEMLRTAAAMCAVEGRVVAFLEPIALYMEKDLYVRGDGGWLCDYPAPGRAAEPGAPRVYEPEASDLTILTFGNGVRLSLQAARALEAQGLAARIVDLRWLSPLSTEAICAHVRASGRALIVDETRATGGLSEGILTALVEGGLGHLPLRRVVGADTYIPLGNAWEHVLPQTRGIVDAALELCR